MKAGNECVPLPVSPMPIKVSKGLSQESNTADYGVYETEEGEFIPKDEAEREAEFARVDAECMEEEGDGDRRAAPNAGAGVTVAVEEEDMEVAQIKARRSPKEPTQEERLRHEATHVPYRSWCPNCVRGRGRRKPH